MAPQTMWEMEFYQLRPHKPSSSRSADHTNLVARPFIPLSSTSELHRAVLNFKKDTSQAQLHSCSVPSPLSQSDFAEIRGVTSDDSQAHTSRRQGKKSLFADPSREEAVSDTGLDVQLFQICAAPLKPAELKKFTSKNNTENKSHILLTHRLIRSDSGKGKSGLVEQPPLSCHPKYFKILAEQPGFPGCCRITFTSRCPRCRSSRRRWMDDGQRSAHICFSHVYPVLLCLSGQANI